MGSSAIGLRRGVWCHPDSCHSAPTLRYAVGRVGRDSNAPAVLVSQTRSRSHLSRSVVSRSNNASVFVRTSVNGRPARRVVWLTGKS